MPIENEVPAGEHAIGVLLRGWVIVGRWTEAPEGWVVTDASVVRRWGTNAGLGELAAKGPRPNTRLDPLGTAHVEPGNLIMRIPTTTPWPTS